MKNRIMMAMAAAMLMLAPGLVKAQMNMLNKAKNKAVDSSKDKKQEEAPKTAEPASDKPAETAKPKPAAAPLKNFDELTAAMADPKLEAKILTAAQSHAKSKGWNEQFSKVKIQSNDWIIKRNEITGIILARTVDAWVYATWPDGHCTYQVFGFTQNYDGVKYQENATFLESVGAQSKAVCN